MRDPRDPLDSTPGAAALPDEEADAACPWCGEPVTLLLDPGGATVQRYVEDCPVCCRPWNVDVRWDAGGGATVTLTTEDD